jgi:polyisoprenyl-phosphate glycosyltransferase
VEHEVKSEAPPVRNEWPQHAGAGAPPDGGAPHLQLIQRASSFLETLQIGASRGLDDAALVASISSDPELQQRCGWSGGRDRPTVASLVQFRGLLVDLLEGQGRLHAPATGIPELSIVSPVYLGAELLPVLIDRLTAAASEVTENYEIVLVDDGSPDRSWGLIAEAARRDRRVKGIKLSRNFGQHPAITAGLDHASGEWVVVMDCDLQDDPRYIKCLLSRAREGYDVVFTVKDRREHGWLKNLSARLYGKLMNWLSATPAVDPNVGAYSILSSRAVQAFRQVRASRSHYLLALRWLGFATSSIAVVHQPRPSGKSSYGPLRLARHALVGIASHTNRPLYAALGAGGALLGLALLLGGVLVAEYVVHGYREGWTMFVVLVLLASSANLLAIGTLGVYVGRICDQVNQRPLYVPELKVNL